MRGTISHPKALVIAAAMAAAILAFPGLGASAPAARGADQTDVAGALRAKLDKSQYKNVQVSVDANDVATLSGTVALYEYKADADKTAHKVKGVKAVRNDIEVAGPNVPDDQLQKTLAEKLTYNGVGYGNVFDAISVEVRDGVATLGGHVHDYPNRDSALATVATTPGVKDMVDEIAVDPVSTMDNQTRIAVARAIYSFPSLNRYAIDPAMPIRISVQNGNVELYGLVDSEADKDAAGIRANSVPGVFSVKNYLQVAGQPTESKP